MNGTALWWSSLRSDHHSAVPFQMEDEATFYDCYSTSNTSTFIIYIIIYNYIYKYNLAKLVWCSQKGQVNLKGCKVPPPSPKSTSRKKILVKQLRLCHITGPESSSTYIYIYIYIYIKLLWLPNHITENKTHIYWY